MGAGQSIDSSIQELKSEAKKLEPDEQEKALRDVNELEDKIKDLIKDYKDKKSSGNEPASGAAAAAAEAPAAEAPAKQQGGKRLKKRRISNKKRVRHRLTRSLKLI